MLPRCDSKQPATEQHNRRGCDKQSSPHQRSAPMALTHLRGRLGAAPDLSSLLVDVLPCLRSLQSPHHGRMLMPLFLSSGRGGGRVETWTSALSTRYAVVLLAARHRGGLWLVERGPAHGA